MIQYDKIKAKLAKVLIDTWWNVNMKDISEFLLNNNVLIDTWWNVNQFDNGEGVWGI